MLAQAVEEEQGKKEAPSSKSSQHMNIRERILSVQYEPKEKEQPAPNQQVNDPFFRPNQPKTEFTPPKQEVPSEPGFAPKSTAQPTNGGILEGEVVKAESPEHEEDPLESASGVGGLSSKNEGSA